MKLQHLSAIFVRHERRFITNDGSSRTIIFHKQLRLFSSSQVFLFSCFWLRVIVRKNDCSEERTIVFHKRWSLAGYVKLVCGKANCNISQPFSFVTNDGSSRTMVRDERSFFTNDWDCSQVLLFSCFWLRVIVLKNGCSEEGLFSRMIVLKNDCSQERTIVFHIR